MDLSPKKVLEILTQKGVTELHHANSVLTSCQFLRRRRLLSRGSVERSKLFQTPQTSDQLDKDFSIWHDVFTDSVDIHDRASAINVYGPVLFILDIESALTEANGSVWITKANPTRWPELSKRTDRWFSSHAELRDGFRRGDFGQMIVFRHCGGELPIQNALKGIILDDPKLRTVKDRINYYSAAYGALGLAMTEGRISVSIKKRICPQRCKCTTQYHGDKTRTREMFFPEL